MALTAPEERHARLFHLESCLRSHPEWSDTWLAQVCRVHRHTVGRLRRKLEASGKLALTTGEEFRARMDHLEGCLRRHPHWSDTRLAKFCRVHRNTVKKLRDELEATGAIAAVDQVIRVDGTPYPYRTARLR